MGWGESGFNCWGGQEARAVLFLFYVNVSGIRPPSRLSSQPLTVPGPSVILHIEWSIPVVSTLGENWEGEPKASPFSLLLLFRVFLSLLFS